MTEQELAKWERDATSVIGYPGLEDASEDNERILALVREVRGLKEENAKLSALVTDYLGEIPHGKEALVERFHAL